MNLGAPTILGSSIAIIGKYIYRDTIEYNKVGVGIIASKGIDSP